MGLPDFDPAPLVALPREPRRRGRRALLVAAALAVAVTAVAVPISAGVFDPGPGEPGWQPLTGVQGGSGGSTAGYKVTQVVTNEADEAVTVEEIRTVAPPGFVQLEAGTVPADSWILLDFLNLTSVTKVPFTIQPGEEARLFLRFRIDCRPTGVPERLPLRILVTVSMGAIHQEVEIPDVRTISRPEAGSSEQACP